MRKKVFASIVFLVTMLFAVVGWAAVYYLSPSGSATPPYDTWKKAANNLSQILSLDLTGENTIYVAEGTYSGNDNDISLTQSKHANLSIIGVGQYHNIIFNPGTTNSCVVNNSDISNVLIKNITIKNEANCCVYIAAGDNLVFENCQFITTNGHYYAIVWVRGSASAAFKCCLLCAEEYGSEYVFRASEDASATLSYCQLYNTGSVKRIAQVDTSSAVTFSNCILGKCKEEAIYHNGSGTLEVSNSIILGAFWDNVAGYSVYQADGAGTVSVKNCVVLPATLRPKNITSGDIEIQNLITSDPKFHSLGSRGFIIPRVDDVHNVDYAKSLASLLAEYGYKGSYFIPTCVADTVAEDLRELVQGGIMEVGNHSHSHTNLTYTHALHFEYTGTDANPTVELDSSGVIHLRTDGDDDVDIDTTQPNADTLGEIISNYSGTNNWTISKSTTDGQQTDEIRDPCKSSSLAEMSATPAPCDIDFLKETNCENGNCKGFFKTEIYEPKTYLTNLINAEGNIIDPQTGQIYQARTFVPPFNDGDSMVKEAVRTSGYLGGQTLERTGDVLPLNVYTCTYELVKDLIEEGDEQQTTKNAELFAINVAANGLVVTVLAHNESEATLEEWRWILNGFKRAQEAGYNIQVTSLQLAIEALKKLGTYDPSTGDVDIHRSMPSFKLRHDSPCIDAGIKLPIHDENWRDLAGNRQRYGTAPDIGCYEYNSDLDARWGRRHRWMFGRWGVGRWKKNRWTPYKE